MIDEKKLIEELEKRAKGHEEDAEKSKYENFSYDIDELLLRLADEVDAIIEVINEQPKVGEWIPVSERLPETDENRKYLVCGEKGGIYIAEFVCNTIHGTPLGTSWWTAHGRYCPKPIAWMPLPEPYKE